MTHLGDQRLLELGLDLAAPASRDEAAHLGVCEHCAAALASERELSRVLAVELPREEPSRDFVARARVRFRAARAARAAGVESAGRVRPSFRPVAWSFAASAGLAVTAVLLLAADAGQVLPYLVVGAKNVMVMASALALVASKVPLGPVFVAASSVTVLIGWSLAMGQLMNLGAREINVPVAA